MKYGANRSPSPLGVTTQSVPPVSRSWAAVKQPALGGDAHPGPGVGVGQAHGGEQHRPFAFLVDLPGRGVLQCGGVVAGEAEDVLDLVAGAFAGVEPVGPLPQGPSAEVGGEEQTLEVLAGLGVPRPRLWVACHAGGLDQPLGDPVGGVVVDGGSDRRPAGGS